MLIRLMRDLLRNRKDQAAAASFHHTPAEDFLLGLHRARDYIRKRKTSSASAICARIFGRTPGNARVITALHEKGVLREILTCYQAIASLDLEPGIAHQVLNELAYCQSLDGDVGAATESYARAFNRLPNMPSDDLDFHRAYNLGLAATQTWESHRRRPRFFNLIRLLKGCLPLEGDIAECGCWRGLSSYLICSHVKRSDAAFDGSGYHIFDSFEGLSAPTAPDEGAGAVAGKFSASLESVKRNLSEFPHIDYHPGWIPLSFAALPDRLYRFVHVDVDLYDPTLKAFEYFYERLASGGHIVCDDYNWPGARQAIEEFALKLGIEVRRTDTTQAYFVKP